MSVEDNDREFILNLMSGLLNIKEQFDQDVKKLIGPPYYIRKGNLEVIDSILQKLKDHMISIVNKTPVLEDPDVPPNQMYMINPEMMDEVSKNKVLELHCSLCHKPWSEHITNVETGKKICP